MKNTIASGMAVIIMIALGCESPDNGAKKDAASTTGTTVAGPTVTPAATAAATTEPSGTAEPEGDESASATDANGIPAIPTDSSTVPTLAEWDKAPTVNTQAANSRPPDCYMKVVREWLKVHCDGDVQKVSHREHLGNEGADAFEMIKEGKMADFVIRLKPGKTMKLRIWRKDDRATLFVNWPSDKDRPAHIALGICKPNMPCWPG